MRWTARGHGAPGTRRTPIGGAERTDGGDGHALPRPRRVLLVLARPLIWSAVRPGTAGRPGLALEWLPGPASPYEQLAGQQVVVSSEKDSIDGATGLF